MRRTLPTLSITRLEDGGCRRLEEVSLVLELLKDELLDKDEEDKAADRERSPFPAAPETCLASVSSPLSWFSPLAFAVSSSTSYSARLLSAAAPAPLSISKLPSLSLSMAGNS